MRSRFPVPKLKKPALEKRRGLPGLERVRALTTAWDLLTAQQIAPPYREELHLDAARIHAADRDVEEHHQVVGGAQEEFFNHWLVKGVSCTFQGVETQAISFQRGGGCQAEVNLHRPTGLDGLGVRWCHCVSSPMFVCPLIL